MQQNKKTSYLTTTGKVIANLAQLRGHIQDDLLLNGQRNRHRSTRFSLVVMAIEHGNRDLRKGGHRVAVDVLAGGRSGSSKTKGGRSVAGDNVWQWW